VPFDDSQSASPTAHGSPDGRAKVQLPTVLPERCVGSCILADVNVRKGA
jgi:hypothetical protein